MKDISLNGGMIWEQVGFEPAEWKSEKVMDDEKS